MIALREATDNADSWMFDSAATLPPGIANRTVLQGQIVWSGLQDGYSDAGASDSATPYATLYWLLGEVKTDHCEDCPDIAMGSPYDPPWAGAGSNQLTQSPGDGQTECGAACKCSLSYEYPSGDALQQLGQAIQQKWNNWIPVGYSSAGDVLTQPVMPPGKGSTLTIPQKAALDEFRNASDMWDAVRRNLPAAPSLFGTDDLPTTALMPAWGSLTQQQQATVTRIEQALDGWLTASAALVPPPVFLPDPGSELVKWLQSVAVADWPNPDNMPDTQTGIQQWLDNVGKRDWPAPNTPNAAAEIQAWLDSVAKKLTERADRDGTILLVNNYPRQQGGKFGFGPGGKQSGGGATKAKGSGAAKATKATKTKTTKATKATSSSGGGSSSAPWLRQEQRGAADDDQHTQS